MKLSYQVTGQERKALVSAISAELNTPARYTGAPAFAYEVGGYTIDKDGMLSGPNNLHLKNVLSDAGFTPIECVNDEPFSSEPQAGDDESSRYAPDTITIEIPYDGDPAILRALLFSKATLISAALGATAYWYSPPPEYSPENPGGWYGPAPREYILPIEFTDSSVKLDWFAYGTDSETIQAWSAFLAAAAKFAKAAKRITAKDVDVENQKFSFRVFLIRLGLVGTEYKATRQILLRNLTGCSAWKHGAPVRDEKGAAA